MPEVGICEFHDDVSFIMLCSELTVNGFCTLIMLGWNYILNDFKTSHFLISVNLSY